MSRQRAIKRDVAPVAGIESLGVRQHFDEGAAGLSAAYNLLDGIAPLRVDLDACKELIRISFSHIEHISVAYE